MTTASLESAPSGTANWVRLLRHLVAASALLALLHLVVYRGVSVTGSIHGDLTVKLLAVFGFATFLNALWALFFTERSKGHFTSNLIRLTWVLTALVPISEWSMTRPPSTGVAARGSKLDQVRSSQPKLSRLSDAEVLRVVAHDYPEVPIERIANDLGLKIVRQD